MAYALEGFLRIIKNVYLKLILINKLLKYPKNTKIF